MKKKSVLLSFFALLMAITVCLPLVACKKGTPGPESGSYYFDDSNGYEQRIELYDVSKFTLTIDGIINSGDYKLDGGVLTFSVKSPQSSTIVAQYKDETISFTYSGRQMKFLRYITYLVEFDSLQGTSVSTIPVINGRRITNIPVDPTRTGYHFRGWFRDNGVWKNSFRFDRDAIKESIKLYAFWVPEAPGATEFDIKLDFNYTNAPDPVSVQTIGGKLYYNETEPQLEGYVFKGWWISFYSDPLKLAFPYEFMMEFQEHTTLYALWQDTSNPVPVVWVKGNAVEWEALSSANVRLEITPNSDTGFVPPVGFEPIDRTLSGIISPVSFSTLPAGDYVIKLTAGSASTTIYYRNKALARASIFEVYQPSQLIFNKVKNATEYFISADCGNSILNVVNKSLGNTNIFDFSELPMPLGGIKFNITARAANFVDSVAEYKFERFLPEVDEASFVIDGTQTLKWNMVLGATNYKIRVTCGDNNAPEYKDIGNQTNYSLKNYAPRVGGILVDVIPEAFGFSSPPASRFIFNKTTLASPKNIRLISGGTVFAWDPVTGADSYIIKIEGEDFTVNTNQFTIPDTMQFAPERDNTAIVIAKKGATSVYDDSLWSDPFVFRTSMSELRYEAGIVSWDSVVGADSYQVRVNGGRAVDVDSSENSANITLTQPGTNIIEVRSFGANTYSNWKSIERFAYAITFNPQNGSTQFWQYYATGDKINYPTVVKEGYDFVGWFTNETKPEGLFNATHFSGTDDIILYAHWAGIEYAVTLNYDDLRTTGNGSAHFVFGNTFKITNVPTKLKANGDLLDDGTQFVGWYTELNGKGTRLTDQYGNGLKPWSIVGNPTIYAFWGNVLSYKALLNETYNVTKGTHIELVTEVFVPVTYNGVRVTVIEGFAFSQMKHLVKVNIPKTIELIEYRTAFSSCDSLAAIIIYDVAGHTGHPAGANNYFDTDGILFRDDSNHLEDIYSLLFFPKGKTGEYRVPDGTAVIAENVFAGCSLSKIIIPTSVIDIRSNAFQNSKLLEEVYFEPDESGEAERLTIRTAAFTSLPLLKSIDIPARVGSAIRDGVNVPGIAFDSDGGSFRAENLEAFNVNVDNAEYADIKGVLVSKDKFTLLQYPKGLSGDYVIPDRIRVIAAHAFRSHRGITGITISQDVDTVGTFSFFYATNLIFVKFVPRLLNLTIQSSAFVGCSKLETIEFQAGSRVVEIGDSAFSSAAITEITIPGSVTRIGNYAFRYCRQLVELYIEEGGSLAFGSEAFAYTGLTVVYLPASVTSIASSVFLNANNLSAIVVDPESKHFKSDAGVLFDFDMTTILYFPKGKTGEYIIPESITTIPAYIFENAARIESIVIPHGVTSIGVAAFRNMLSLTNVTFLEYDGDDPEYVAPDLVIGNVEKTGDSDGVFFGCTSLGSIALPGRATQLGGAAFKNCTALESVTFGKILEEGKQDTDSRMVEFGDYAFQNTGLVSVHIPKGIRYFGFGGPGTPELANYLGLTGGRNAGHQVFENSRRLKTVTFEENSQLQIIGIAVFQNTGLESITLPAGLKYIGSYSFRSTNLRTITIPKSVIAIAGNSTAANGAFSNAYMLEEVIFEKGGTEPLVIGASNAWGTGNVNAVNYTFNNNRSLRSIEIPARTKRIGNSAFYGCLNLEEVTFEEITETSGPRLLESIGSNAFYGAAFSTITIPNTVRDVTYAQGAQVEWLLQGSSGAGLRPGIGNSAFASNVQLTTIDFEPRMDDTKITFGTSVFENTGITSITLPKDLVALGDGCFSGVSKLTAINIDSNHATLYSNDGVLYNKVNGTPNTIIKYPEGKIDKTTYQIGKNITAVGNGAFRNTKLTQITFESFAEGETQPDLVLGTGTSTGTSPFAFSSLTSFEIPTRVSAMGQYAFDNCADLTSVTIKPGGRLSVIPSYTFQYSGLTGIGILDTKTNTWTIPDSITDIQTYAFRECANLESIMFGDNSNLEAIGSYAFQNSGLTSITLPGTLTGTRNSNGTLTGTLPSNIFSGCEDLVTAVFKSGAGNLTNLGTYTFEFCYKLQSVTIPAKVTTLNVNNFRYCPLLEEIKVPDENTAFRDDNGILFNKTTNPAQNTLVFYPAGKIENKGIIDKEGIYVIPSGTAIIGTNAFDWTVGTSGSLESKVPTNIYPKNLKKVEIPLTVTTINQYAFRYTQALETVTFESGTSTLLNFGNTTGTTLSYVFVGSAIQSIKIPARVTSMVGTFRDAAFLKDVTFETEVALKYTTLGERLFEGTAIEEIEIPEGVTTVANSVFTGLKSLVSVSLPSTLTALNVTYMFFNCSSLTTVNIPEGVTGLGNYFFSGATSLSSITLPSTLKTIGTRAFYNNIELTSINLHEGLESIGNEAFLNATKLSSINLPDSLTSIGTTAFSNTALIEVTIPDKITAIPATLFDGCGQLVTVNTHHGILSIGENAFRNCINLVNFELPGNLATIGPNAFQNDAKLNNQKLHARIATLGTATVPSNVFNGWELEEFEIEPDQNNYSVEDGVLFNFNKTTLFAYPAGKTDEEYTIPNTVTAIAAYAFAGASYLKKLNIIGGVTTIGVGAFANTTNLEEVVFEGTTFATMPANAFDGSGINGLTIPASVTSIGNYAFARTPNLEEVFFEETLIAASMFGTNLFQNSGLKKITIPRGLTTVPTNTFDGCARLEEINLPVTVTTINNYAFQDTASLENIVLPPALSTLGSYAFQRSAITEIIIPGAVTSISFNTFTDCKNLVSVDLPNVIETINSYAFQNCIRLVNINLPNNLSGSSGLGSFAFAGCESLEEIVIPPNVTNINASAFADCTSLEKITIPNGLTKISNSAFKGCTNLTSIIIPRSLANSSSALDSGSTEIQGPPFEGWTSTQTIYMHGITEEMGAIWTQANASRGNLSWVDLMEANIVWNWMPEIEK